VRLPALSISASMLDQGLTRREARPGSARPAMASSFATMCATAEMLSDLPAEDSPLLYHYLVSDSRGTRRGSRERKHC